MKKNHDLAPFIDYFDALKTYERWGFLEVIPDKHEAYMTRAAFLTLCDSREPGLSGRRKEKPAKRALRNIRLYAGWLSADGTKYLKKPFALHIVNDNQAHDVLFTLLVSRRKLFRKLDVVRVIEYDGARRP